MEIELLDEGGIPIEETPMGCTTAGEAATVVLNTMLGDRPSQAQVRNAAIAGATVVRLLADQEKAAAAAEVMDALVRNLSTRLDFDGKDDVAFSDCYASGCTCNASNDSAWMFGIFQEHLVKGLVDVQDVAGKRTGRTLLKSLKVAAAKATCFKLAGEIGQTTISV